MSEDLKGVKAELKQVSKDLKAAEKDVKGLNDARILLQNDLDKAKTLLGDAAQQIKNKEQEVKQLKEELLAAKNGLGSKRVDPDGKWKDLELQSAYLLMKSLLGVDGAGEVAVPCIVTNEKLKAFIVRPEDHLVGEAYKPLASFVGRMRTIPVAAKEMVEMASAARQQGPMSVPGAAFETLRELAAVFAVVEEGIHNDIPLKVFLLVFEMKADKLRTTKMSKLCSKEPTSRCASGADMGCLNFSAPAKTAKVIPTTYAGGGGVSTRGAYGGGGGYGGRGGGGYKAQVQGVKLEDTPGQKIFLPKGSQACYHCANLGYYSTGHQSRECPRKKGVDAGGKRDTGANSKHRGRSPASNRSSSSSSSSSD
jgi:hypothetical protein